MSVDFAKVQQENPEWTNCLFFNGEPAVLHSSLEGVSKETLEQYVSLFNDYDSTIKSGFTFNDVHYHVHRFYDGLIYGRADPNTKRTDGFCLFRTEREGKTPLYAVITYDLPNVSARMIPLLNKTVEGLKDQLA
ncbi:hypothetical protein TRFO_15554 [Tritrichomonas foetus]|uniref:Profilin n=1 Tax=Tritrichomonas foetus TaxID=1144522 RepID=A0A1J4KRZ0_9EUKA|nr:hypothetical protein TRFO_15554 [Tritrichomonas foetus]|eukprot:OHT14057.1 hypothetical protein TRFO_15554 [Tritrichomonas foetus]